MTDDTPETPDSPGAPTPLVTGIRRTRRGLWIAVGVVVPILLLVVVLATRPAASTRTVRSPLLGKAVPAAESATIDGETVKLSDLKGQWVVVNFFATWCVPCQKEHPELVRFAATHALRGDASVVSVVFDDELPLVRRFFEQRGGTWPVVGDSEGEAVTSWGVSGVPESYLVAPDGTVLAKLIGGIRSSHDLDELLARFQ
jgi:cytochrome c biogenesis protein CcmG/thiol:disulfide interchange protein DsbE